MTKYNAHLTTLKVAGATTAMSAEACTLVSGRTYQLNTAAKRVLDPAYIPSTVIKEGSNTIAAQHCTFDCLFGKVTIADAYGAIAGAVTFDDAKYIPLHEIVNCYSFTIDLSQELSDITAIDAARVGADHERMPALLSASGTLSEFDFGATIYDGAAAVLNALWTDGTDVLIDINIGNSDILFRAWAKIESLDINGEVADIQKSTHKWTSKDRSITGSATTASAVAGFNFSDT